MAVVIIGVIGALVYFVSSEILLKLQVDDQLKAFPIHCVAGLWRRLLAVFSTEKISLSLLDPIMAAIVLSTARTSNYTA